MKIITTSLLVGILVGGLLLSPLMTGKVPFLSVFAQESEDNKSTEEKVPNKHVTLIANETTLQVAPDNPLHPGGIWYAAMTFNGTIPGPAIAVDQGDTVNITIHNAGKVIHSLDFHAGDGPSNVLSGNIMPGQAKSVVMKADNAGAYMYHCGADALNGVWEHIANGMYGAVIVHPEEEEKAKEFYISFGELYNSADKGVFAGTNGTVGSFDIGKFINDQPDLILTNGMAHKYVPGIGGVSKIPLNPDAKVFMVKPGELTRWYVLSPGPNNGVAFHFISGQISVRDGQADGNFGNQLTKDETWWIPPGSASVVEITFPEPGLYVGVDHNMNHVVKGGAFAVLATENSTAWDQPTGSAVAPKGSESPAFKMPSVETAEMAMDSNMTSGNTNSTNSTTMNAEMDSNMTSGNTNSTNSTTMNAEMAANSVSIVSGASNPSNPETYSPASLNTTVGSTVTWTNNDATIHTVTAGSPDVTSEAAPAFDSGILAAGKTFTHTFDTAGTFDYYCTLHPFMKGKVVVS